MSLYHYELENLAHCDDCGWTGVPTSVRGVQSDLCPRCHPDAPDPTRRVESVPRNAPCPCGSGVKFKKCCGR